jgi:hypothetical protein
MCEEKKEHKLIYLYDYELAEIVFSAIKKNPIRNVELSITQAKKDGEYSYISAICTKRELMWFSGFIHGYLAGINRYDIDKND